jgi:hypothetical protein
MRMQLRSAQLRYVIVSSSPVAQPRSTVALEQPGVVGSARATFLRGREFASDVVRTDRAGEHGTVGCEGCLL